MTEANSGQALDIAMGEKALSEGLMGTVILAGGMGTRLGFPHPKGMYPIAPITGKSLFQLFAEKCLEASLKSKRSLPLAIMTSPENDLETRAFFKANDNFGLKKNQLYFFTQDELHLENEKGEPLPYKAANGNGGVFKKFVESGLWDIWKEKGTTHLNIIPVDNVLADPFDTNLLGYHLRKKCDVTLKCTERASPEEKVGLIIQDQGKIRVIEYSEATNEQKQALTPSGKLKYPLANLGLFCLSFPFVKELSQISFPYHLAKKPLSKEANSPLGIKKETFIFDLLPYAKSPSILIYPRNQCFAPLKNKTGEDSPDTVRKALS